MQVVLVVMWLLLVFAVAARVGLREGLGQVEDGDWGSGCLRYAENVLMLDGCDL